MPRVLLVEDERGIAEALVYQLAREGYDVHHVADGADGLRAFERHGADVVLLDLMLPGMAGEEVCKRIRATSSVPIIMLTARDSETDKVVGLEIGADDYMTKPFSTRELLARVKAVLRRAAPQDDEPILEVGQVRLDTARYEVTVDGHSMHLPRKEFQILQLLMRRPGSVLTRERLIDEVWGTDYFGDTRTLDVHIKRLRDRLDSDAGAPSRIKTVRGVGFKFVV